MLVASDALLLSPPDPDEPLKNPIIGWHNIVTPGNIAADTEAEHYPVINLTNASTISLWRALDTAEQYLTITPGENEAADYVGMARHNLGMAQIPVSLEAFIEDTWVELIEETQFTSNAPIMFRFPLLQGTPLRLRFQSGLEPVELAVLYAGKLLVMQRGITGPYTPLPFGLVNEIATGESEAGDYLGRIILSQKMQSAPNFVTLTPEWVREKFVPFMHRSIEAPFFFAWWPSDYPKETGFAWLTEDIEPSFDNDGFVSLALQMTGIGARV